MHRDNRVVHLDMFSDILSGRGRYMDSENRWRVKLFHSTFTRRLYEFG